MFPNLFLLFVAEFLCLYTCLVCPQIAIITVVLASPLLLGISAVFSVDAPEMFPSGFWASHGAITRPTAPSHWPPDISALPQRQCWPQSIADTAHSPSSWLQSSEIYYGTMTSEDRGVNSDKENVRLMPFSLQR